MSWLIAGLALFLGVHVFTSLRSARERLIAKLGEGPYKGLYSLLSLAGFGLIVAGMSKAPPIELWDPPAWGRYAAIWFMPFALILLVAAFIPGNLKRFTAHPMLWSIALWALVHLLANGDLAGLLLFGGFGLYALYAMWSQNRRGVLPAQNRRTIAGDIGAVVAGLIAYALLLKFHANLFGVAVWY
ncbi:MAG: NnrU family protein [Betaproteobacteria bacterium]|nr:NnrU family protein [Betaproteobacteria bacterium]